MGRSVWNVREVDALSTILRRLTVHVRFAPSVFHHAPFGPKCGRTGASRTQFSKPQLFAQGCGKAEKIARLLATFALTSGLPRDSRGGDRRRIIDAISLFLDFRLGISEELREVNMRSMSYGYVCSTRKDRDPVAPCFALRFVDAFPQIGVFAIE
jgi:hypothetical protein